MNPKETDSGLGIPGSHLMSFPTSDCKGEMRRQGAGGGRRSISVGLWGPAVMADLQQPAASLDS